MQGRRLLKLASIAGALSLAPLALTSVAGAKGASNGKSPIVIGFISSLTGVASSDYADAARGAQARVDAQNAEGGVNGHPLKLVVGDDQSSPANNATVAEDLVQTKGAFGVIDLSSFTFGGAPYLTSHGIPVTGYQFDGPEWSEPSSTNMFSYEAPALGPFDGTYYGYDSGIARFLKAHGVTKMGGLSYGISPSAQRASNQLLEALNRVGVPTCYNNTSVPFGAVDFTADVLSLKSAGCNGVEGPFVESGDVALSQAVKNGGLKATQMYFTGYNQTTLSESAARSALDGDYITNSVNFTNPNTPTKNMLDTLAKYDHNFQKSSIPDIGLYNAYLGADLMIYGLQHAGANPTRQSFITNLRKVTSYNAEGVLPSPVTFAHLGSVQMLPKQSCEYMYQLNGGKFVEVNGGKPICSPRAAY